MLRELRMHAGRVDHLIRLVNLLLQVLDNLVGNATPDMNDGAPGAPANGPGDGSGGGGSLYPTPDQSDIDNFGPGNFVMDIDVHLTIENIVSFAGSTGVVAAPITVDNGTFLVEQTLSFMVRGMIAQPGGLVDPTGTGSLPADFNNDLVVDSNLIINDDLFA